MAYVKLFSSILDSSLWERDLATKVVWITMLAMSDRDGLVSASVPGLARRAGVTTQECEAALAVFLSPDVHSRTKDFDGRRIAEVDGGWELLNFEKYRRLESAEDRREKDAERQRRKRLRDRDSHAVSRDVTPVTTCHVTSRDSHGLSRHVTPVTGSDQIRTEEKERGRGGAPAHTHARAREGQSSDPVETADPSPANESGPRTDDRHHDATHAAPHSSEARKTHPGATPIQADPNDLATIAATIPGWATAQVGTAQMTAGYRGDPKASWARFVAHIFACRERGEARQLGAAEWLKWLTNEQRYERSNGQSQDRRDTAHKPERRILKPAPKKTPEELAAEKEQAAKSMAVLGDFLAKVDAEKAEEERQREATPPPKTRRFM